VRRAAVEVLATAVIAFGGLTAFRLLYFGHPLPNTYYAKVPPDVVYRLRSGVGYLWDYVGSHAISIAALCAVALWLLVRTRVLALTLRGREDDAPSGAPARLAALTAGLVTVGVASVVYGGGDHYQGHRFLQPYLPMVALPLGVGVDALLALARTRLGRLTHLPAALVVAGGIALLPGEWRAFRDHGLRRQAFDVGLQGRFVGATLNQVFARLPSPEVGLWMVGGAGYAYTGPVKDLLGLNWIAMGMSPGDRKGPRDHAAFNADVFWSAPPDLMIPEPEAVLRGVRCVREILGGALHGVLLTERFRTAFEPVRLRRGDSEPLIAYARADWLREAPPHVEPLGWGYCEGA
jgi:hypothetical protein